MKRRDGLIKAFLTCMVLMLAVPFALRLLVERWLPSDDSASLDATEKLRSLLCEGRTPDERALALLQKPLAHWSELERKAEPEVCAWLSERQRTILPWEWSEAARKKDARGYEKSRRSLVGELQSACKTRITHCGKRHRAIGREITARTGYLADVSNLIARLETAMPTNGLPQTVMTERLEKGWLWGFARKREKIVLASKEDVDRIVLSEKKKNGEQRLLLKALEQEDRQIQRVREELSKLLENLTAEEVPLGVVVDAIRLCDPGRRIVE